MENRTFLAIILTITVWGGWFWLYPPQPPQQSVPVKQTVASKDEKAKPKARPQKKPKSKVVKYRDISKKIAPKTVKVDTDKFHFVLSNKGASIVEAHYIDIDNTDCIVEDRRFKTRGNFDFAIYFSEHEFLYGSDLDMANWAVEKKGPLTVAFTTEVDMRGKKLRLQKIYLFTARDNTFQVSYKFINNDREKRDIRIAGDGVIVSPGGLLGPKLDYSNTYNVMRGVYSLGGDYEAHTKGGSFFGEDKDLVVENGAVDYAGLMSRYLLLLMKPEGFYGQKAFFDKRKGTTYRTGMSFDVGVIEVGSEVTKTFKVYLGEKDKELLGQVDPILKDASDVNTLIEPIRYFVMWMLLGIYKFVGNLGWALVIFSILTKIVFMPLTQKSTASMKKLQEIGPELKKLQAKYKDKPDVLQRETMRMYKENNVNPMGGCLPLILQMPFFFGLYSALINSPALWNAPFILWIKDLSMPDDLTTIAGYDINLLPVLMAVSMFVQQKQTMSDVGNQQQKIMMYMMPFLMLLIFWNMPSGLVLYWFLQNLYQILHQYVVNHMDNRKKKATA